MLVYERCAELGYHPVDTLIEIARNKEIEATARVKAASELIQYFEGKQPESRPHVPATPEQSVEAVKAVMRELESASKPIEPIASDKPVS
jgi:O6-methylguanine-DNA--protein-cysteine methyltransferase